MTELHMHEDGPTTVMQHNGDAMAAMLGAGIGAFAMGFVVIIGELGVSIPAVYAPAGGVSGRTTLAAIIWIAAWALLHHRWKDRDIEPRRVHLWTLLSAGTGVLLTFPPVWKLL